MLERTVDYCEIQSFDYDATEFSPAVRVEMLRLAYN